ncbi:MAG: hypothetical protein ACO26Y_05605, partial [Burkholderiaceae bacterium]
MSASSGVCVAIDCMGGDHGLPVTIPAALAFLKHHPDHRVLLVGRQADVAESLAQALGKPAGGHTSVALRPLHPPSPTSPAVASAPCSSERRLS